MVETFFIFKCLKYFNILPGYYHDFNFYNSINYILK
jgi:hypothetical protein